MSKVIKSVFVNKVEGEKKTIAIKKVLEEAQGNNLSSNFDEQFEEQKTDLIDEELRKAMEQAETIRTEAQKEYEELQNKMNQELLLHQQKADEIFQQAEEAGYNIGFQQGLKEGQKQYDAFIQEARTIVHAAKNDYFSKLEEAEPTIVQLALTVAEKIISNSIDTETENFLSIVKAVINEVREQEQVKLYVNPKWYEYILAHKEELKLLLPNCESLYIFPDLHLQEHGCQIETKYGKIDASVDSQLAEIKYALLEKIRELGGNESC